MQKYMGKDRNKYIKFPQKSGKTLSSYLFAVHGIGNGVLVYHL